MNRKLKFLLLAVSSSVLLSIGWFDKGTGLPLLVAFVPLLWIEEYFFENRDKYSSKAMLSYIFPALVLWYTLDTWWVFNASAVGVVIAILANSTMFAVIFWFAHIIRRKLGSLAGYTALLVFWVYWEYFYMHGEITWPWLNLGNGLAHDIRFIQWYEYTGTLGGSFWILLSNILIFRLIKALSSRKATGKTFWLPLLLTILVVFVPMILSVYRFNTYKEKTNPRNIVVIQPNIDPYNEKFFGMNPMMQTQRILQLAASKGDSTTDYFVAPETALNDDIWLNEIHENRSIKLIEAFMKNYPRAKFIIGATEYRRYEPGDSLSPTARPLGESGFYYDSYNAALQIDTTNVIQQYFKSMLVVGVEKMPYARYLKFLQKLTLRLGGTFRSHATQAYRSNLYSRNDHTVISPVICYESVFGEYVTDYIKLGSDFIFIITNDGWWKNTPGYKQHNSFAALRAIENRRSIARSANTGMSSFVNQRGEFLQKTKWWTQDAIKATLNANRTLTFYTRHGDYIARFSGYVSLLIILGYFLNLLILRVRKK